MKETTLSPIEQKMLSRGVKCTPIDWREYARNMEHSSCGLPIEHEFEWKVLHR